MNLRPLDLVSAHPWQRVAFTTYALSLSFFEAVILDALVRARSGAQPVVLADVHGVRECLSEQGAHRVGTHYEIEPLALSGGVFHPKITVLTSGEESHLLIGSGNLTFNGWGGNCEAIEHLHPSFAADAIADTAEFFERLPLSARLRHGVSRHCTDIAASLRRAVQGRPRNGNIRFLHNLDRSLTDQMVQAADDLGGARQLIAVAPFWDSGGALDHLCRALRVNEAFIHAHAKGCVVGNAAGNWPREPRTAVHAVRVAPLDTPSEADRRLHAKMFEILCRRGRLVISGSANGTARALGGDGNIEACVLRIQRNRTDGWRWVRAEPLHPNLTQASDDEDLTRPGVLRATLQGNQLIGRVLTPHMTGTISIYHLAATGPDWLADAVLDAEGVFSIVAPDLEKGAWRIGRLVLRVLDGAGRSAEGFVSLASYAEISRRSGVVARRLLAVIFGTEGPQDVHAILNWFLEDPKRLSRGDGPGGGGEMRRDDEDVEQLVSIAALKCEPVRALSMGKPGSAGQHSWLRFFDQILAAFREPRRPFIGSEGASDDDDDDELPTGGDKRPVPDPAIMKIYGAFNRLFEVLTRKECSPHDAETAFDLTGFVCARLRPDIERAREWLKIIIRTWMRVDVRSERRADVAASILTVLGTGPDVELVRWARSSLLSIGVDLSALPPSDEAVRNYQTVLIQRESFTALWKRIGEIRTYPEQVQAYVKALERGKPSPGEYPDLPRVASDVWSILTNALTSPQTKQRLLMVTGLAEACPRHHVGLPKYELDKFRRVGIATTKNCCGKVIIRTEG